MGKISDFFFKIFKEKTERPWLDYYSRKERKIKFTDKSIYDYMIDEVGNDKDFICLNYFENRISYNDFLNKINICARALREFGVKEGDVVLYAKYSGTDIKMDGVEYKILSIKDALAVIE